MPDKALIEAMNRNVMIVLASGFVVTLASIAGLFWTLVVPTTKAVLAKGLHAVVNGNGDPDAPSLRSIAATQEAQGKQIANIHTHGCDLRRSQGFAAPHSAAAAAEGD